VGAYIWGMLHIDMRSLAPAAQEERRRQVIGLRERGLTYEAIGQQVGLSKNGVFDICQRYRAKGMAGLQTGPRGPAPGTGRLLTPTQEAEVRALICDDTPDGYALPFALWSRAAVAMLIERRYGVRLAVRTMGTYLARWNFTPQKPLRRAYEQDPEEVEHWLEEEYPAIQAKAKRQRGRIFWADETGLRSDDVRGRSYAPRGETPVVRPSQKRANVAVISAVTNQGELRWMVLHGPITAPVLISFLERLIRDADCKVFLILDRLRVHQARVVKDWLAEHRSQIEVFYLPAYSPQLNPNEGINGDLKQATTRKPPARTQQELKRNVVSHMRRLSKMPKRIQSFFQHPTFRYAA
jgi:transposase